MAKINFTKGEKFYTAEFQINGPTAIHIERNKVGPLYLKQKSVENGQYDFVKDFGYNRGGDLTIDTAIQGVVYPMWIKIESASEPTLAEMVEGEQSGGGAGTESVSKYIKGIEYYAVDYDKLVELGYDSTNTSVTSPSGMLNKTILPACGGKLSANGESMILGPGLFNFYKDIFTFAGITGIYYINVLQQNPDDPSIWFAPTFKERMASLPIGGAFNEALTEITEEEFYNLEA